MKTKEEIEQLKQQKKERILKVRSMLSNLSEKEREDLIAKIGTILTIEGHPLSIYNTLFLYAQNPVQSFSVIGGFQQWNKANRKIKKGEHSYLIFAPVFPKKPDDFLDDEIPEPDKFLTVNVFDISQTEELKEEITK